MPRVSVCLAVYNGEEFLQEALDSVHAQTFRDYEIVAIDDGSTDSSATILESANVRLVRQQNAGLGAARRRLVEEASGDLIAFIDHDDAWLPTKLERQVPLHDEPGVVLSHTGGIYQDETGKQWERIDDVSPEDTSWSQTIPLKIIASTAMFSRAAMLQAGNFVADVRICSDWYGWLNLARFGNYRYLAEPLVRYRVRGAANSAPGMRFFEAERYLLEEKILPSWGRISEGLSPTDAAMYKSRLRKHLGATKRSIAHYARLAGDRPLAMRMHREAIALDPLNLRYWLSWLKNGLVWRP